MMTMTNTVHPPGGATALLAVIDPTIVGMGWIFVPLMFLGSLLMFLVALGVNNLQRIFPVFWWTPRDVGWKSVDDVESGWQGKEEEGKKIERIENAGFRQMIVLSASGVVIPEGFALDSEQVQMLEVLRDRLREWNVGETEEKEGQRCFESGSDTTHVEHTSA
jgi:HPP family